MATPSYTQSCTLCGQDSSSMNRRKTLQSPPKLVPDKLRQSKAYTGHSPGSSTLGHLMTMERWWVICYDHTALSKSVSIFDSFLALRTRHWTCFLLKCLLHFLTSLHEFFWLKSVKARVRCFPKTKSRLHESYSYRILGVQLPLSKIVWITSRKRPIFTGDILGRPQVYLRASLISNVKEYWACPVWLRGPY
jgi:hypothetical protein